VSQTSPLHVNILSYRVSDAVSPSHVPLPPFCVFPMTHPASCCELSTVAADHPADL
jgi:hypothetical protein